jgi:hypothetical protein
LNGPERDRKGGRVRDEKRRGDTGEKGEIQGNAEERI